MSRFDVSSRQEFVNAYVNYVFNLSVDRLFEGFNSGFHKVCGGKVLDLFQPSELQAMIIGNTYYDWTELEKVRFMYFYIYCTYVALTMGLILLAL